MRPSGRAEQLSLDIALPTVGRRLARLRPMLPTAGDAPFDDPEWFFEPWWPGAQVLVYVEHGSLVLQTGHLADPLASFPELEAISRQFSDRTLIVEGTLLVLDAAGRPDADLLRRRLASDPTARGEPAVVASDVLYLRDRSLIALPFEERRSLLAHELSDGERCVVSRGLRGEGLTLAEAAASMGLSELSARLLAGRYRPGQRSEEWLRLPVMETPAEPTRPLLALLQRLPL